VDLIDLDLPIINQHLMTSGIMIPLNHQMQMRKVTHLVSLLPKPMNMRNLMMVLLVVKMILLKGSTLEVHLPANLLLSQELRPTKETKEVSLEVQARGTKEEAKEIKTSLVDQIKAVTKGEAKEIKTSLEVKVKEVTKGETKISSVDQVKEVTKGATKGEIKTSSVDQVKVVTKEETKIKTYLEVKIKVEIKGETKIYSVDQAKEATKGEIKTSLGVQVKVVTKGEAKEAKETKVSLEDQVKVVIKGEAKETKVSLEDQVVKGAKEAKETPNLIPEENPLIQTRKIHGLILSSI